MWPFGKKQQDITVDVNIDYAKLADAIAVSQEKSELRKQEKAEIERQRILEKRKEILKEKDFSHIKFSMWREIRVFFNNLRVMWNLFTLSREDAKYFTAVSELTRLLSSLLLYSIGFVFYLFAAALVYGSYSNGMFSGEYILFSLIFIALARIIRIARFEVERMENQVQLMNIAMMLIALITLVATIVSGIVSSRVAGG